MADTAKTEDTLKVLQAAAKGLTFMSESDRPVKAFLWKREDKAGKPEVGTALQAEKKVPEGATVKTLSVEDFFAPMTKEQDWFGDEEKATAKRFQDLITTLKAHLSDVQAFRLEGGTTIDAYVIGSTSEGDFAGVHTQLVET